MVTMKQIDEARGEVARWRENRRQALRFGGDFNAPEEYGVVEAEGRLRAAEVEVDRLLREWWAQGCREVVTSAELEAMLTAFGNVKFDLGAMRVDGDTARAEAKRLKALILGARMMSEAQCVAADVLASRDAITKERDNWKSKYDVLNKHREDQEREIDRLKRVCAQNAHWIEGLQRALEECKKDRDDQKARVAKLEKRLGEVANERNFAQIERDALRQDHGGQVVTREWIEDQINKAINKHCAALPHLSRSPVFYR